MFAIESGLEKNMHASLSAWIRAAALCMALLTCLAGCDDTHVPAILSATSQGDTPANGATPKPRKNRCYKEAMYLVDGDTFTFLSGGQVSIGANGSSGWSSGSTGWNPEIEARAKCWSVLNGTKGSAKLLWNDEVVDEFAINKAFLMSDQVAILSYEDADGTRVEFHIYAQPECGGWAFDLTTRAEIEALER
jgi:hypothetical protein